jgi:hypothetical protein
MNQPALKILARQRELVQIAREATDDVNEAGLLVHHVIARAFVKYRAENSDLTEALRRDLRAALGRGRPAAL